MPAPVGKVAFKDLTVSQRLEVVTLAAQIGGHSLERIEAAFMLICHLLETGMPVSRNPTQGQP